MRRFGRAGREARPRAASPVEGGARLQGEDVADRSNEGTRSRPWGWLIAGVVIGVAGLATFNFSLQATSTTEFCSSCHADNAAKEWKQSKHFANAQGVQVGCPDCHLPHAFGPKMIRKVQAVREVWGHFAGTIGTAEKYEAHRMEMAKSEWASLKANGAQGSRRKERDAFASRRPQLICGISAFVALTMHVGGLQRNERTYR